MKIFLFILTAIFWATPAWSMSSVQMDMNRFGNPTLNPQFSQSSDFSFGSVPAVGTVTAPPNPYNPFPGTGAAMLGPGYGGAVNSQMDWNLRIPAYNPQSEEHIQKYQHRMSIAMLNDEFNRGYTMPALQANFHCLQTLAQATNAMDYMQWSAIARNLNASIEAGIPSSCSAGPNFIPGLFGQDLSGPNGFMTPQEELAATNQEIEYYAKQEMQNAQNARNFEAMTAMASAGQQFTSDIISLGHQMARNNMHRYDYGYGRGSILDDYYYDDYDRYDRYDRYHRDRYYDDYRPGRRRHGDHYH